MRRDVTLLSADDTNNGAGEWLSSEPRRKVTAVLGTVVGLPWVMAVVLSVASWAGVVPVTPFVVADGAAFAALPAVLWLAGNLVRLINLGPRVASYNPVSRLNLAIYGLLLGLTRPSRRTVSLSLLTVAISATVIAVNGRLGWNDDVSTRIFNGLRRASYNDDAWEAVSRTTFRAARASELRSDVMVALIVDGVLMLSMVGLYRLGIEGARDAALSETAPSSGTDRLGAEHVRPKRRV